MLRSNMKNHRKKRERGTIRENSLSKVPVAALMICLLLVSMSLFIFQVTLTRVFSSMLRYHFVFLLTSMSIFGLGIGGYIAYRLNRKQDQAQMASRMQAVLLVLAASFVFSFSLIYKLPFISFYVIYALIAALPFVVGGVFVSSVFMVLSQHGHKLYFADLLGAGIGSFAVIGLMNLWGPVSTILIITALAVVCSLILSLYLSDRKPLVATICIALIFVLIGVFQRGVKEYEERFTGYFTSPLTILSELRLSDSNHSVEDWSWDAYSRTDVIETDHFREGKIVSIDGGSISEMIRFDGDLSKVERLRADLNYLPFATGSNDQVLLIGPGGGKDILLALLADSKNIHAVEINRGSVRLAKKYGQYNGNIYDQDNVELHVQDGRNFVKQTQQRYDMIYLAKVMTEVAETVGYALAENFIYTKEAVLDYWRVLDEDGRLAFILHDRNDTKRMLLTIQESLKEAGISKQQLGKHLIVVSRRGARASSGAIHMPLVMVRKSPFTLAEVEEISELIEAARNIPLHLPYKLEGAFLEGINKVSATEKELGFFSKLNHTPTTDNRPYFFDFMSGVDPNLLIVLAGAMLIGLIFFRPSFLRNKLKRSPYYFVGLGLGFMLIEVPLIQMYTLYLGHPTRSFIVVLVAVLTGGGVGSLVGGWRRLNFKKRYLPLIFVPLLLTLVWGLTGKILNQPDMSSLAVRVLVSFSLLFPLGFFMGMPFPFGIRTLHRMKKAHTVPLMWGINGIMSIGGSVLAIIISMKIGLSYSLLVGGLIYLTLFFLMPLYEKDWRVIS